MTEEDKQKQNKHKHIQHNAENYKDEQHRPHQKQG
jgi:hypothetical protein